MKLRIPHKAMQLNGWADNTKPNLPNPLVNKAITEARKIGKTGNWILNCTEKDAEIIAELIFHKGEIYSQLGNRQARFEGRYLLNIVDQILEQVDEYNT